MSTGPASAAAPLHLVVMGVSGCGKSSVGRGIADALGLGFVEGDELHGPANVAKMAAGASMVQFYTGMVYRGPELVHECVEAIRRRREHRSGVVPPA